jgi:hypothetical protein
MKQDILIEQKVNLYPIKATNARKDRRSRSCISHKRVN